jgi:tRNA threonylcarbamoyladenosine biosynthesis protein TsaB
MELTYILHIESATKSCSVALSLNGELKQIKEVTEDNFSHGENLTLFIEEVLKCEKIDPKQLHAISISSGPGSYTGLRIGVSVAKGLCYSLSIPLIAIDSLEAIFEIAKIKHPNSTIIPMIDARRMEVFSSTFDINGEKIKAISADIINETSYSEYEPFIAVGDGAPKLSEIWSGKNCQIDREIQSSATGQCTKAFQKFQVLEFEDVAYFEPFYLKDFISK